MSELINLITGKENWETKIQDPQIVQSWRKDLLKQGVPKNVINLAIDLLKLYRVSKDKSYDDSPDYPWVLDLIVNPGEYVSQDSCECLCRICSERGGDASEDISEESAARMDSVVCLCTPEKLSGLKYAFLRQFLSLKHGLIDTCGDLASLFKEEVGKLESDVKRRIENSEKRGQIPLEYQPDTDKRVINLVHPSLNCYISGVSTTMPKLAENVLFQWLPAEFQVRNKKTKIKSPINNLDPKAHSGLYEQIAQVFSCFVPKFEKILKILQIKDRTTEKYPVLELINCQVIVKLSNTVLTPDNPVNPAGNWHLEGLPTEKIIATGIYYYEMNNITTNYLQFRTTIGDSAEIGYPQNDHAYVEKHYGFFDTEKQESYNEKETAAFMGQVRTNEGLCLVFPNFFQHRVSEFELIDKTKVGNRKILVFFLIDPSERILSTADIDTSNDLSEKELIWYRELLMFQRKYEMSDQSKFFERGWSLCEH